MFPVHRGEVAVKVAVGCGLTVTGTVVAVDEQPFSATFKVMLYEPADG
ncbi:MAG: hypothetical protein M0D57_20970 [Sphingobacteriales bacterium JAD_PAG50586_3]|nr:MAG: hypothetical protein M0D57_20970 [Sphingobacteriales bacterium JAD_PAG50586_3]